ncbi:MAG TPA: hypothetical protein H9881_04690, partial [Candidatus Stackebrandtia excrementipullorum]|nr:hypothetical protein [Candidatus Stackebrandtia excrementipullorum]
MIRTDRPVSRPLARFLPLTLITGMLLWLPVADMVSNADPDAPEDVPFVAGEEVDAGRPPVDQDQIDAEEATRDLPTPVWPSAATVDVTVGSTLAVVDGIPVAVGPAPGEPSPSSMQVNVHDQAASEAAGVSGVLIDIDSVDSSGVISVELDYSDFAHAHGADWATRLGLWKQTSTGYELLESLNHRADETVRANVSVEAGRRTGLMLAAEVSGPTGDFSATALSPSATWSHGGNSGGFNWSYPLTVPNPVGAGPVPEVALDYSSASVDGRTEATNNQPGWVGEGWGLTIGSIERRYGSCAADMDDDANNVDKTGDKCWVVDGSVMLTMAGRGGEVIRDDDTGEWRLKNDDGTKFEKLNDTVNADNSNEYWRVTTPDGVRYYFGLNRLPGWSTGDPETKSAWTVPVAGNHPGEPCHASTFASSFCDQAWKWNLDYVEDSHGNTMSYWYAPETNKYGKAGDADDAVTYTRGGELTRIDYGTDNRDDTEFDGHAPARVLFTSSDRCLTDCDEHDESNWPDTPWDTECTGSSCTAGQTSPSFWSSKRLSTVTTQVWDAAEEEHQDIDSWSLTHSFPNPGDGTRAGLWLDSIVRTGHVGGDEAMPEVSFDWVQMHNRVEVFDGVPTMNWMRIADIWTESGGRISLEYSSRDCADGDLPSSAGSNTRLCYPVKVPQQFDPEELETHWYHKYVLTAVMEYDLLTERDTRVTEYEYVGDPAWRYAQPDELVEKKYRTWSDWRGYPTVLTRVGKNDSQTLTEINYFRGMHGDKDPDGGTRSVSISASVGDPVTDDNLYAGMVRESTVYNGTTSNPVSRQVFEPWKSSATATRTSEVDTTHARYVRGEATRYQQTALDAERGWRTTMTENTFDDYGAVAQVADHGDVDVVGDERCYYTEYARNPAAGILDKVQRTYGYALACGQTPETDADVLSDTRHHYDGRSYGSAPTKGAVTLTETINDFTDGTPGYITQSRTEHDDAGRIVAAWDVRDNATTTVFIPSTGVVTSTTTTNPMGWTTSTDLDLRGNAVSETDFNGKTTTMTYDPLGRLAKVWLPNLWNPDPDMPSYAFEYQVSRTGENAVTTRVLNAARNYTVSTVILDGLLRARQTQAVSPGDGGGRILVDTLYDDNGREAGNRGPYRATGEPDTGLFVPEAGSVPNHTETVYDRADRVVASIQYDLHEELWRTSTVHGGDYTTVIPPNGGTPTTSVTNALGNLVELRQHLTPDATGAYQSTFYEYTAAGQLENVTDPEGNAWEYVYDLLGRQISTNDPDKGESTTVYNDYGDVVSTTDARGSTLAYEYDQLGRNIGLYEDDLTGTKLSEWRFDRLLDRDALGQFAGWSRFVDGNEYRFDIRTYNDLYQPGGVQHVIPESEGALAGTYVSSTGYALDGTLNTFKYADSPAVTGESLSVSFHSETGLPDRLTSAGGTVYVTGTSYTGLGELESVRFQNNYHYTQQVNFYDDVTRRLVKSTVYNEAVDGLVSDTRYVYDDVGNVVSIGEH